MPKLLLLLSCWFITSGSICQSSPTGFPDTPTITETSVGKAQIGMSTERLKAVYKGCTFVRQSLNEYGWEDNSKFPAGLCVKYNKVPLFVADLAEGRIVVLVVISSFYKTSKGIHVGSSAATLKQALSTAEVYRDKERHDLQTVQAAHTDEGEEAIAYHFRNAAELGNHKSADKAPSRLFLPLLPLAVPINWITITDTSLDI